MLNRAVHKNEQAYLSTAGLVKPSFISLSDRVLFFKDLFLEITRSFSLADLFRFALLSKNAYLISEAGYLAKAHRYGYKGSQSQEAKEYLKKLFEGLKVYISLDQDILIHRKPEIEDKLITIWQTLKEEDRGYIFRIKEKADACLKNIFDISEIRNELNKSMISLKRFLQLGANPNITHRQIPLLHLPIRGSNNPGAMELLSTLLKKKNLNVNIQDGCGRTALQLAVSNKDENLTLALLKLKADPNIFDRDYSTPLQLSMKQPILTKHLIEHGADPNLRVRKGNTALHIAAGFGKIETIKFYLSIGADPSIKNHQGQTALDLAKKQEIKSLLMKKPFLNQC